jgi:hypothetical protein
MTPLPFIAAAAMFVLAPNTSTHRQSPARPAGAPPAPEPNRALMQSEGLRRTGGANNWTKFQVYQDPSTGLYYAFRAGVADAYGISGRGRKMTWSGKTWLDAIPAGESPGHPTNRDSYPTPAQVQAIQIKRLMKAGVI